MYDQGSMDRIGRLMSLRDLVTAGQMAPDAAPLPMNTLRNNTTGAEYKFDSVPQGAQSPRLDYSRPIEIFGLGKGYAIKGQPLSAMINGRRVDYGVDSDKSQAMTQAAQDRALKLEQVQQGLDAGALDIAKKRMENSAMQSTGGAKPLTESQGKAAGFGVRANDADSIIRDIGGSGDVQPGLIKRTAEAVPFVGDALGTLTNWTQSEPQQKVEQAQRNFINAVLRRESGAAIGSEEFDNARTQYFPQPGDEQGTIAQKQSNRQAVIAALKTEGAHGYEQARAEFDARKAAISGKPAGDNQADSLPDPRQEVGTIITDNSTGVRMQSNGRQWRIIGRGGDGGW